MRDFLTELVVAAEQVAANASCGLTLVDGGRSLLVSSSDQRAAALARLQHEHGGPLTWSIEHVESVAVADVCTDDRWPAYSKHAVAHDVRSSFTVPAVVDDDVMVVLSFYAPLPDAFGPAEQRDARRYAEEADRSVALALRLSATERMAWQLELALESRSTISQAVGVIMSENRCDADEAFQILRSASQNRNIKLRDLARQIIASIDKPARV